MKQPPPPISVQQVRPEQAAQLLGLKPNTLAKWRKRGSGPPWRRAGGRAICYDLASLQNWITSQPGGGDQQ